MSENAAVFSASRKFTVPILSGSRKTCTVRFPTDQEWCERSRRQRSIRRFLGRGKSEAENLDSSQADLDLFDRIRVDDGADTFDGPEAALVLAKLERTSVEACEREGDNFRLALKVPGALTEHLVRIPTRKEMDVHEAASVKVTGQRRAQEIRGFLEPSGALYDSILKENSGYEGPVPIVHKVSIVSEVLSAVAQDEEDPIPEA